MGKDKNVKKIIGGANSVLEMSKAFSLEGSK